MSFPERPAAVIAPQNEFLLPDETWLSELFSNNQVSSALSVSKGRIQPGMTSKIHLHPVVEQITYVLSGELQVVMKGESDAAPYAVALRAGQAVHTDCRTYFQLMNESSDDCEVLYLATPSFQFVTDNQGQVVYNDAVVLDADWDVLAANQWVIPQLQQTRAEAQRIRSELSAG